MYRVMSTLAAACLLVAAASAQAPSAPSGNYKLTLILQKEQPTYWLLKLDVKMGVTQEAKAEVLASAENAPDAKVTEFRVKDGTLRLGLKAQGRTFLFVGKLTGDPKKVLGSFALGGGTVPAVLEQTTLQNLDSFDVLKDSLSQAAAGPEIFANALQLLRLATPKNAKIEDIRAWSAKASKAAEAYGDNWQREVSLRIADSLFKHEEFLPVALVYARQAERLVGPADGPQLQRRVLGVLGDILTRSGKTDEAKEVKARLDKIPIVALSKAAGRKGAGDRAVLVELFTGAECPPCVAADLAFDALGKTYKPGEVVLLQYHLHIPGPDPLTNPDAEARLRFYGDDVEGTPTIFFSGKADAGGGGGQDQAQEKYDEFLTVVDPQLEKAAKVKLQAKAVQKGNKISITADVADLAEPGDKTRLRIALVEDEVAYKGGNRLETHHHVVRSFPGGAEGVALKDKSFKHQVSVDLDEVRKKLKDYLDDYSKNAPFRNPERPMELKNLKVVAFVQNDATREILQAVQVPITLEK